MTQLPQSCFRDTCDFTTESNRHHTIWAGGQLIRPRIIHPWGSSFIYPVVDALVMGSEDLPLFRWTYSTQLVPAAGTGMLGKLERPGGPLVSSLADRLGL
jgi:hypothetical protein